MDIVRKILRTTVILGSISVNPHFTIHCSNAAHYNYQTEPDAAKDPKL